MMKLDQVEKMLKDLQQFANVEVRVVIQLSDDISVGRVLSCVQHLGYAAHPERSAFSDFEVVITGKVADGDA